MRNILLLKFKTSKKEISFLLILMIFSSVCYTQTTLVVTSSADTGANSLRQIINGAVDGDTIIFSGIDTIKLGEPLLLLICLY